MNEKASRQRDKGIIQFTASTDESRQQGPLHMKEEEEVVGEMVDWVVWL